MNMKNILDLPDEINILIVKLLDIESQKNVYYTCTYFKNLISMYGVVTSCKLCMNIMATAKSLKLQFFKDIAMHLRELNLSAMSDLNKTSLVPAIKKLKKLHVLDVSYTRINIVDLLDIHQACPTIKDVSINFAFDKCVQIRVPQSIIEKCQNMFKHYKRVHFVGILTNLFCSKLPLRLLEKAKLNELQYTITDCAFLRSVYDNDIDMEEMIQLRLLKVFLLNWHKENQYYGRLNESAILSMLDLSKYELIMVSRCTMDMLQVLVSPRFKDFFLKQFGVEADIFTTWTNQELGGNVAFMIWNTATTVFDSSFYNQLLKQLKQFFPYHLKSASGDTQIPANNDWIYTRPNQNDFARSVRNIEPEFKRRRVAPQGIILDYDNVCKHKKHIKLTILFENTIRCLVTLSSSSNYLKKITHLNLTGHVVYSSDFFKILFTNCHNLVAISCTSSPNATQALGRYIWLCKYIKHLRLVATTIDFKSLFVSLSRCKYIENVHLYNMTSSGDIAEPKDMFERCCCMYNLSICMPMSDTLRAKKLQTLNKIKYMYSRDHLNIELCVAPDLKAYGYDPFVDVFHLNPIKVV
ncbi:uncharacterized protein LOC134755904 [Cydia strobilella]|uniref:uncharacterized protein LOC134755904 n=1 Tax=Cydia strobilella TaxID=1100964 RepID=UPI003007C38F